MSEPLCPIHGGTLPCMYAPCNPQASAIPDVPTFPEPQPSVVDGVDPAMQPGRE